MIKLLTVVSVALASFQAAIADDAKPATPTAATYVITGLHCPPCSRTVESSLGRAKGVQSVKVDWATKTARVKFDEQAISAQQVANLVAKTPHMMGGGMSYAGALALSVPEIHDQETAKTAKAALENLPGVAKINAFASTHTVTVQFKPGVELTSAQLIDALDKVGMKAKTY